MTLKQQIEKLIMSMDLGYTYQMSDYASSKASEDKYEAEGLAEVKETVDAILALFKEATDEVIGEDETLPKVSPEMIGNNNLDKWRGYTSVVGKNQLRKEQRARRDEIV